MASWPGVHSSVEDATGETQSQHGGRTELIP